MTNSEERLSHPSVAHPGKLAGWRCVPRYIRKAAFG